MNNNIKEQINQELLEIIKVPTVLKDRDGFPIEYEDTKRNRRMKERKVYAVSLNLMVFTLQKGGNASSLEKFASGDFAGFLSLSRAYTIQ